MTADNTVMEKLKHLVGLQHETEREQRKKMGSQHLKNSEEAALEAAYNAYLALKDGVAVASDAAGEAIKENAKIAAHKSGELYKQSAEYLSHKSGEVYDAASEKAAEAAKIAAKKSGEFYEQSTDYLSHKSGELYEAASEKSGELYDAASHKTGELYDAASEKSGELYEQSAEYLSQKSGELYDAASEKAAEAAGAVKEQLREFPQHAGNTVTRFRDETGRLFERIASSTGDYYERFVEEPAHDAKQESRGVLGGLSDRISHLGHSINGIFAGKPSKVAGEEQYEYVRDAVGDYVLKPVQRAAGSVKDSISDSIGGAQRDAQKWKPYFDSREWKKFFGSRAPADADWWKQYLSGSDVDPRSWRQYVQAYTGGPQQLDRYWKDAKRAGRKAQSQVADKYYDAKSSTFASLESGKESVFGSAAPSAAAAPVSLFWTAVLAMYLLVLAKRIFEQRRAAGHPEAVQQARANSSKADEISEKVRLSGNQQKK